MYIFLIITDAQQTKRQSYDRHKSRYICEKGGKVVIIRKGDNSGGVMKQHIRTVEAGFYEGQAFSN